MTAPIAIILDASSFLVSALFLRRIHTTEPMIKSAEERHIRRDIKEGLRAVLQNRSLRSIAACSATSNLFGSVGQAVFILYATRELNLDAATLGVIYAIASIGGLLGASFNSRIVKRLGLGTCIIGGIGVSGLASLLLPLASGAWIVAVLIIIAARFVGAIGNTIYNINQLSYRQVITSYHLLGRMNASMRVIVWGTIPLGSFIGGILGSVIGLRATLVVGALGFLVAPLWVYFSPVRQLKAAPMIEKEVAVESV
jgi:predicted MFS family arabinose efflux permease